MEEKAETYSYHSLQQDQAFRRLLRRKSLFRLVITSCLLVFYLFFPLLLTNLGELFVMFSWIYLFSLFIFTWLLGYIYWRYAKAFEQKVQELYDENAR
ncbi:Uncharacterized membrane protein, DUF485 family [Oceanobacillus limi]|uniref:Uncharacterized membrane protein, DUF485 family n=1 Tax=Oceanobacillus limi TaxID=930131 RepID=A0A1I0A9W0_9BACI|nr:DUF485 domain-containing protein [Oceanobacillus limi]SES90912.1 Uncharacterized membrane protein, DUF485 family [Oceanobacillus limi]